MRQYRIENSDLWFKIFRQKSEDWPKFYYDVKWNRNENKTRAKLFFHRDDAASALVVIRRKWDKIEETSNTPEEKVEKQSWSELS